MLKYLSITAGIFLIIFPCLLAGQVQPAYELAHHSACPYNGRNYDVYYVWLDSLNMLRYENFYEEGTKVPSLYDSDSLRKIVGEKVGWRPSKLLLMAEYEFPDCPDFVLLKYQSGSIPYFVGYVKSSGQCYILTNCMQNTVRESYNAMVSDYTAPQLLTGRVKRVSCG